MQFSRLVLWHVVWLPTGPQWRPASAPYKPCNFSTAGATGVSRAPALVWNVQGRPRSMARACKVAVWPWGRTTRQRVVGHTRVGTGIHTLDDHGHIICSSHVTSHQVTIIVYHIIPSYGSVLQCTGVVC